MQVEGNLCRLGDFGKMYPLFDKVYRKNFKPVFEISYASIKLRLQLKEPLSPRILRGEENITQHSLLAGRGRRGKKGKILSFTEKGKENDGKYPDLAAKFHLNSCRVFASTVLIQTNVFGSSFVFSIVLHL